MGQESTLIIIFVAVLGSYLFSGIAVRGFTKEQKKLGENWGRIFNLVKAPIKTGKKVGMKKSCGKGLANHTGLESCGDSGNTIAEALTEVSAGRVLSPVMKISSGC